jgi:hypothetical protein
VRVKSQSDIGSMDNLESVVRQNLKGHGVSDRFATKCPCFSCDSDGKSLSSSL